MSRFETVMAVVARGSRGLAARACTVFGFLAVMVAVAAAPQVAWATPSPGVPEIDPVAVGSVAGVVVGALALLEGRVLRRRKDR